MLKLMAVVVAAVVLAGAGWLLYQKFFHDSYDVSAQKEHLKALAPYIDETRLREGREVVEGLAAKRKGGAQDTGVLSEINRLEAELGRMAREAGKQKDLNLRGDYEAWLKLTHTLLSRLESDGRPTADRWRDVPPPRREPSVAPVVSPPMARERNSARSSRPSGGLIHIELNPSCYGPCNVIIRQEGVDRPSVLALKPGQKKDYRMMGSGTIEMENTRPYCADKPVEVTAGPEEKTLTVGCRP